MTSIEWTRGDDGSPGKTWNPTVGCTRVSAGCDNCYAFALHGRRHAAVAAGRWPGAPAQYAKPFSEVQPLPERLTAPLGDASALRRHRLSLAAAERSFSDEAQRIGLGPAFSRWGSEDAANMGRGPAFRIGAAAIGADMPAAAPAEVRWGPDEGVLVASSGDLGVTWGWIRPNGAVPTGQPAAFPFFTIWRRASPEAPWRYVAE